MTNTMPSCSLVWFRDDLRLADNPALTAAVKSRLPVVACYVLDDNNGRAMGAASHWWLAQSLRLLSKNLEKLHITLVLQKGDAGICVPQLVEKLGATHVFWNRRYEAGQRKVDEQIKTTLLQNNIHAESFKASLLFEPWELKPQTAPHYKVYTPFWRNLRGRDIPPPLPTPKPAENNFTPPKGLSLTVDDLELEPHKPDWAAPFKKHWLAGEEQAFARLEYFLEGNENYPDDRDRPDKAATSTLSPYLRFGEISPRTIWHTTISASMAQHNDVTQANEKFLSELAWREFCYHQLYHLPDISEHPVQTAFKEFPWHNNPQAFTLWTKGQTGYPLVDAGMRQLWQTGWMHNRVRMVVASFVIKHLGQDWRHGEKWFWDTLLDADHGSNPANWQWVAGCGADASPYFRVFNPIIQSEKFDPNGDYIREFVPELAKVPAQKIHKPWKLSDIEQKRYGVIMGKDYPNPIVDHATARQQTLDIYHEFRQNQKDHED